MIKKSSLLITKDTPITPEFQGFKDLRFRNRGQRPYIFLYYTTGDYQDDSGYANMIFKNTNTKS